MMDFGYMGSSSNLSPLAPPFTLDRSNPKPYAENIVHSIDPPPDVPYSSYLPSWQFSLSSASNLGFFSNSNVDLGVDSIRTTYQTSENCCPYFGVQPISSPSPEAAPLTSNVSTTAGAYAFPLFSSEIQTDQLESKTYCCSFLSPMIDNDTPLVAVHTPNYDLSSTSQIAPLDGSSHVDYHQSLSDLKYPPQLGRYCQSIDRSADGKMGKQVDFDSSLCSMRTDGFGSYAYKSYPEQGPRFTPCDPARTSGISILPKCHANVSSAGASVTFLNHQKPHESYVQNFQPPNHSINGSASVNGSSPDLAPLSIGSKLQPEKVDNFHDFYSSDVKGELGNKPESYDQSFQPLNANKISFASVKRSSPAHAIRPPSVGSKLHVEKVENFHDLSSSSVKELPNKALTKDTSDHLSKAGMKLELPHTAGPLYSFIQASDKAEGMASIEGPLDSYDRYYPAVDSPCWKGASSFRSAPLEDPGGVTAENLVEKSESFGGLKLQQGQFFNPFGEVTAKISRENLHENSVEQGNGYVDLGSLLSNASNPAHVAGVDHAKTNCSKVLPFSNNIEKLRNNYEVVNDCKSSSDLRPFHWKQPNSEKGDCVPGKDFEMGCGVAKTGLKCNDVSAKLNVRKLVDTIHNLSELLLLQCSNDAPKYLEVDHEVLKHAIENLDACVPKKIVHNPIKISTLSEDGTYHACTEGVTSVTKEAHASACSGVDNHCSQEETKSSKPSEEEPRQVADLLSARVDEDVLKDDKVAQAIKKVFEENFSVEQEMQSEAFLYKNLWLEAEAALCSISYRARYNRMKIEMEKYKPPCTKETVKAIERLHSKVSPSPGINHEGAASIGNFKTLHNSASRRFGCVDEAEDSVWARLHILNNRLPNTNSVNAGGQTDLEDNIAFADVAETIRSVEKLLCSEDSDDSAITCITQKVTPYAKDNVLADNSIRSSPSASTSRTGDNVETSVMARFQILKSRGLGADSDTSGLQSEPVVNAEFAAERKRDPWQFSALLTEDDPVNGPLSQYCKVSEPIKDFHACTSDKQVSQPSGNKGLGAQLQSGWCDGSLSDWEDVLKDEFPCHK